MPERIYKLQPDRTIALRGFDSLGAAAAVHSATGNSFKVSGVFRDPADFAVLILYDADNFYEHPQLRYLPNSNFSGLTLTFDVHYQGLMPLDSPKHPSIAWRFLQVVRCDGTDTSIPLFAHAQKVGGAYTPAQTEFLIEENSAQEFDRLTLWYLKQPIDYFVPKVACSYGFTTAGAGTAHGITVAGSAFTYTEAAGDTAANIAQSLTAALAASEYVTAIRGDGTAELGPQDLVNLRAKKTDGIPFHVSSTANSTVYELTGIGAAVVASALASTINGLDYESLGALFHLRAEAVGSALRITTTRPGYDSNMLTMYATWKNDRLKVQSPVAQFQGGSSDATWNVTLDFSLLGVPQVRQMWLTFAPPLANGAAFTSTEWQATFTNWSVTGPEDVRRLQVAGPNSVRIEEDDSWCSYTGNWSIESGFYSEGTAKRTSAIGDTVTIKYSCGAVHDLYIGTELYDPELRDDPRPYPNPGVVGVRLDGGGETDLNCYLKKEISVITRRKVRTGVPAGEHILSIRLKSGQFFYFDFLEAVVASDVPDALAPRTNLSPALDYSTDHTYKVPPARLMWMFDKLGFAGPMNEYIGVFWWNQRKRVDAVIPGVTVTFNGEFLSGDQVFLDIGGQLVGKTVYPNETTSTLAKHFEYFINSTYVGVWAAAAGNILTVTARSPQPSYSYSFRAWKESAQNSTGTVDVVGSLQGGQPGTWVVDPEQTPALNRGAREWHSDFFRQCQARGREIVLATSMELVNPPQGFAAVYPDGAPVVTHVGFANLKSTHCTFNAPMRAYQQSVYKTVADLMAEAGLVPNLQFGEFLWWFFTNKTVENPSGGMAFYDAETKSAALAALGRPLHVFTGPNDDPAVNGDADAASLRNILRDHVSTLIAHVRSHHPNARFEVLFPYDVNHPVPAGIHQLGGRLNRFVNLPVEWERKETSGFDRLKMEALDFGAWSRNLDLAKTAIMFPLDLGWPRDSVRHLIPIFRSGYPWEKELSEAAGAGINAINLWAFDHVCIYGYPLVKGPRGRAMRF